jgi:hypothetical protein
MKKKRLLIGLALILAAGTIITFAASSLAARLNINANPDSPPVVQTMVQAGGSGITNTVKLKYSTGPNPPFTHVYPKWYRQNPNKKDGTITAGDVSYVDATGVSGNIKVAIYFTDAGPWDTLFTTLDMIVNVRSGQSGTWTQAIDLDGNVNATGTLTLDTGDLSFILAGGTHYDISIDSGDWSLKDQATDPTLLPFTKFYVRADPVTGF